LKRLTFVILCLEGAVLSFNVAAAAALVPAVAGDFAISQFSAGRIVWMYMLPYGVAALIYGPLVRRFDAKNVELMCLFLFSLANLAAGLSHGIASLLAARFFMGVFGASVIPLGLILIARHIEPLKRGSFVGLFFGATFIGSLSGLFLSGIIHWRLIFLIPALCGAILLPFMFFGLPSFKADASGFKINYVAALKSKTVVKVFAYIFLVSILYHGAQQWLGVYFSTDFGLSQFAISMLITLGSLSGIFGEVIGGRFADSLGRRKTAAVGLLVMAVSIMLVIFKSPLFVIAALMAAWGFGWTFNHVGVSTMLTDMPDELLNEAASLNSSVRFVAGGLGVALAGVLMSKSFVLGFGATGTCLLILLVFSKKLLSAK